MTKGWRNEYYTDRVEIIPVSDISAHVPNGQCPCAPAVERLRSVAMTL